MTRQAMDAGVRERIMAAPEALLDDQDVMRALAEASARAMGSNVVDLRGLAMERLEARLGRLEDTHRNVVAAAYDNLAGTALVHRAVLRMLEAGSFAAFLEALGGDVAAILRVDTLRLVLEPFGAGEAELEALDGALAVEGPGFVARYLAAGRPGAAPGAANGGAPGGANGAANGGAPGAPGPAAMPFTRPVTLRAVPPEGVGLHGARSVRSEACLLLDLGGGRPGILLLGSEDPGHFGPQQGTDLLQFLGAVAERALRRWLG